MERTDIKKLEKIMRLADELHFSPSYTFRNLRDILEDGDKEELIKAFKDRVEGYYLKPIKDLNTKKSAFSAGLICVATIDFLAYYSYNDINVGDRFKKWTKESIMEEEYEGFPEKFYKDFRNGLVHEGRIKNGGEFSYDIGKLFKFESETDILVINPEILLKRIKKGFKKYLDSLRENNLRFEKFKCSILKMFEKELNIQGD